MSALVVVAVGGNSLIRDKNHTTVPDQYEAIAETCRHIAKLVEEGHRVVITHGNGPQIGYILLRSDLARHVLHEVPLDSCGADTQGAIGYQFQQALGNEFKLRGIARAVSTVITRVEVDAGDPAFMKPSKPIGPFYSEEEAQQRAETDGWDIAEDAGRGWRRVVPSPVPRKILELPVIEALIKQEFVVVCCGGGGIPVVLDERGYYMGTAAVIDKDHASALLARALGAEVLIISTAVEKVYLHYGTPEQQALDTVTLEETRRYLAEGHFKAGSMLPKIKAIESFLAGGGKKAIVTLPELFPDAMTGRNGTTFVR
jgi:carbamate kinase